MGWVNLNKEGFDENKISNFEQDNIKVRFGKPMCGSWFSLENTDNDQHHECEWHQYLESEYGASNLLFDMYITDKNKTNVVNLSLKDETMVVKANQIAECIKNKQTKDEIIDLYNLEDTENLVFSINSREDFNAINRAFPGWTEPRNKNGEKFWQYITKNFSGCEITDNFINSYSRLDNDFVAIVEIASFVAFDNKAFNIKSDQKRLSFNKELIHMDEDDPYKKFINKPEIQESLKEVNKYGEMPKHFKNIITHKNIQDVYKILDNTKDKYVYINANDQQDDVKRIQAVHSFLKDNYSIDIVKQDAIGYVDVENARIYDKDDETIKPKEKINFETIDKTQKSKVDNQDTISLQA